MSQMQHLLTNNTADNLIKLFFWLGFLGADAQTDTQTAQVGTKAVYFVRFFLLYLI